MSVELYRRIKIRIVFAKSTSDRDGAVLELKARPFRSKVIRYFAPIRLEHIDVVSDICRRKRKTKQDRERSLP